MEGHGLLAVYVLRARNVAVPHIRHMLSESRGSATDLARFLPVPEIHLKWPLKICWLAPAGGRISHKVLCRARAALYLRRLPMDTQTVIATCEVLLVVIGIIGLVLVRRE